MLARLRVHRFGWLRLAVRCRRGARRCVCGATAAAGVAWLGACGVVVAEFLPAVVTAFAAACWLVSGE